QLEALLVRSTHWLPQQPCPAAQAWPHAPQLSASLRVSAQRPVQHESPCAQAVQSLGPPQWSGSCSLSNPSSTWPSQLSSRPLHTSAEEAVMGRHCSAAPPPASCAQRRTPAAHTPCWPVAQASPSPWVRSSTAPLQSSSFPLHCSGNRVCWPTHAPQWPPAHVYVPFLQMPLPSVALIRP